MLINFKLKLAKKSRFLVCKGSVQKKKRKKLNLNFSNTDLNNRNNLYYYSRVPLIGRNKAIKVTFVVK